MVGVNYPHSNSIQITIPILIAHIMQSGMFAISGENLTKRMRTRAFKSMLSQEIGWFDAKENNVGTLTTKLAIEASAVQGVRHFSPTLAFFFRYYFKALFFKGNGNSFRFLLANIRLPGNRHHNRVHLQLGNNASSRGLFAANDHWQRFSSQTDDRAY